MSAELTVVRAAEVALDDEGTPEWLVEGLWSAGAVGVIGGAPKCCKSWLALEMAVAVASGRPCLGRFAVPSPGSALVYMAEDAPLQVRERVENLSEARGADFSGLDVGLIVEPSLRLDRSEDVARLRSTLAGRRPKFLVLDPYVRLQRVDENNATEVSAILATLRELSRTFGVAIALVHHARKSPADHSGQALRGSSDFHAWGDSNLYLRRRGTDLVLAPEHRAAATPAPIVLTLAEHPLRLEIRDGGTAAPATSDPLLSERILAALAPGPMRLEDLRLKLAVRKQSLAQALRDLESAGRILRKPDGWALA
jgi:hypothetical protein